MAFFTFSYFSFMHILLSFLWEDFLTCEIHFSSLLMLFKYFLILIKSLLFRGRTIQEYFSCVWNLNVVINLRGSAMYRSFNTIYFKRKKFFLKFLGLFDQEKSWLNLGEREYCLAFSRQDVTYAAIAGIINVVIANVF